MKHGGTHVAHGVVASEGMAEDPETVSLLLPGGDVLAARVHAAAQSHELTTAELLLHVERRRTAVEQIGMSHDLHALTMCSDVPYSSLRIQPVDIAQRGRRPVDKSTASPFEPEVPKPGGGSPSRRWVGDLRSDWEPHRGPGGPGEAQLRLAGVVRVVELTVQGGVTGFPSLVVAPQVVDGLGASPRIGSRGFVTIGLLGSWGPANAECIRSKCELVAVAQGHGAKSKWPGWTSGARCGNALIGLAE